MKMNFQNLLRICGLSAFTAFALASCAPKNDPDQPIDGGEDKVALTVGAEKITPVSVVLKGKADIGEAPFIEGIMGIEWSTDADFAPSKSSKTAAKSSEVEAGNSFAIQLAGLAPETVYYYRAYAIKDFEEHTGERMQFTTKAVSEMVSTLDATEVLGHSAVLNGRIAVEDVPGVVVYGFSYGTAQDQLSRNLGDTQAVNGLLSIAISELDAETTFFYKAWVKIDGEAYDGEVKSFSTTVISVESISLDVTEKSITTIGETFQILPTILPADAKVADVTWSSDHPEIASVDNIGIVTAVGNGVAIITATTVDGGKTATCTVDVKQAVTSISLDKSEFTLFVDGTETLVATVLPENAYNAEVQWVSSNPSVATVSAAGVVTAVGVGTASITAKAQDGSDVVSPACVVTVEEESVDPISVDVNFMDYGTENGWVSGESYSGFEIDGVTFTATADEGKINGVFYPTDTAPGDWRFYQARGGSMTLSVTSPHTFVKAVFNYSVTKTSVLLDPDGKQVASGEEYTMSGNSVTFTVGNTGTATNGQVRIHSIHLEYL